MFLIKQKNIEYKANDTETIVVGEVIFEKRNKYAYEHVKVYSVENVINQIAEIY